MTFRYGTSPEEMEKAHLTLDLEEFNAYLDDIDMPENERDEAIKRFLLMREARKICFLGETREEYLEKLEEHCEKIGLPEDLKKQFIEEEMSKIP